MIGIGRPKPAATLVELMRECHERIRRFAETASRLASAEEAPPEAVREAARGARRYFAEALPLHAADEDESLVPRLRGQSEALDAALARMAREHEEHRAPLAKLIALLAELEAEPARRPALAAELGAVIGPLAEAFRAHLELEERLVLPAAGALPAEVQDAILAELRARRAP